MIMPCRMRVIGMSYAMTLSLLRRFMNNRAVRGSAFFCWKAFNSEWPWNIGATWSTQMNSTFAYVVITKVLRHFVSEKRPAQIMAVLPSHWSTALMQQRALCSTAKDRCNHVLRDDFNFTYRNPLFCNFLVSRNLPSGNSKVSKFEDVNIL